MAEQTSTSENEQNDAVFDKLTGTQKSAILMMLLGEDEASEILRNLSPKEVQHLGTAMYSVHRGFGLGVQSPPSLFTLRLSPRFQ